jgi:LacI family transcriptional regulator
MVRGERITIKKVASEAGVSTQTVSRVFNLRPDVAPATREKVMEVIQRLGYHPSALARSLSQKRSYTLGVVTAGLRFIGPSRTLSGIAEKAEELGFALLLSELPDFNARNFELVLSFFLAHHVDGILWAVPEVGDNRDWVHDLLFSLPVPILFLTMEPRSRLNIVRIDNQYGGFIATQHLIEMGYRRIGHISGPLDWWEARQRKEGWVKALKAHNLPAFEAHSIEGTWSSSSGEKATRKLLQQNPDLDAIFVANDQMALGTLQVCCREGLTVPDRLGVVGFDGISESAYFFPALSTVSQDHGEMGATAVQVLVSSIEKSYQMKEPGEAQAIVMKPQLIVRESSSRPDDKF